VAAQTSLARKRFRQFLLSVALLHVTAIAGYYVLGVARAPSRVQRAYAWTWMGATVAVVFIGLQRVKRARARTVVRRPGSEPDPDGG
jgi:hypothetical protein